MSKQIEAINEEIRRLRCARVQIADKLQKTCKHKNVIECDYTKLGDSSLPPRRICLDCRKEEEGWGCGYYELATREEKTDGCAIVVKKVERQEIYNARADSE